MLNRKDAPAIHDAIEFDFKLPPLNVDKLDNGLPLYWLNAGVQEVVEICWIFPAGIWYEQGPAIANATAALLKNGTAKHTAHQLHEAIEFFGASLKVSSGNDYATVTLHSLTKHLPSLLPIVHEIITEATFPQEELDIYKQNSIQRLLVSLRQSDFVANQQFDALLFGDQHPYGRYTKKESIEALTREGILEFYKKQYSMANVKMFMSGKIDASAVAILNDVFGKEGVSRQEIFTPTYKEETVAELKHRIMNDPNGVQGAIRIGRHFPNRKDPDYAPLVVLNTLFGGYFGSRLMSNIREDKGYTYGIYSSLSPMIHGGMMTIHTEAGRDVLESAVTEVYHEMETLRSEIVEEDELLLVKNYLLGNLLGDLDGPFSIMQRWKTLILNGLSEEDFNNNIKVYKSITAPELQKLALKYYDRADFHELVVI